MLLFHGTVLDDRALASVLKSGLLANDGHWVEAMLGPGTRDEGYVFAATRPVAGRGGDPLSFALGWPVSTRSGRDSWRSPGYVLVLEVPRESILGALRNDELERHFDLRDITSAMDRTLTHEDWSAIAEDDVKAWRSHVELTASTSHDALRSASPATIRSLVSQLTRARSAARRAGIAAEAGIELFEEDLDDLHVWSCDLCVGARVASVGAAIAIRDRRVDLRLAGTGRRLHASTVGRVLDASARWLRAHSPRERAAALARGDWRNRLSVPRDVVPRELWPDLPARLAPSLLREPDVQVLLGSVPPELIRGVIRMSDDGRRLTPELRSLRRRGERVGDALMLRARRLARSPGVTVVR